MTGRRSDGQALVEIALVIPVLLLLLVGSYISCRSALLHGASESAAQTEAIRAGRNLGGLEKQLAASLLPRGEDAVVRSDSKNRSQSLLPIFPSLAGRTKAIVEIQKGWNEIGGNADFPPLKATWTSEMSVDCWGKGTSSGDRIRRSVFGFVATGALH